MAEWLERRTEWHVITKLYDSILCKRLQLWFCPLREQASAQKERGCQEQFVTLRLLINYALFKKLKLFVVFVDFTKAYDTVPRDKLMRVLRSIGCSLLMITAIATLYCCTKSILGTAIITATVGVRQGSLTLCILFIIYLNLICETIARAESTRRVFCNGYIASYWWMIQCC